MKGLGTVRTRIRGRISAILTVSYFNCKLDNNCDFTICFYQNSFRAVESVTGNPKSSKHRIYRGFLAADLSAAGRCAD